MKILHVIPGLSMGGAEKLLTELVPAQIKAGNVADVCVFDPTETPFMESLIKDGAKIITLGKKSYPYDFKRVLPLRKLIRAYDVVHAHCTPAQYLCSIAASGSNAKLVTTEHTTNNRRRSKKWLKPFENYVYGKFSAVVGCSDKAADVLSDYLPKLKNRICSIPNGLDIEKYSIAVPAHELNKLNANEKRMVMIGRFQHPKNQAFLIKSLGKLDRDFHLYLIGDGEARQSCEKLAAELGVSERVHFLGKRTDVPSLLKCMDIMTHASHWEGLPVSILEGMAAGLPVVGTDVQGIKEVTEDVGLLYADDDLDDFVQKVISVFKDSNQLNQLKQNSQNQVSNYSIEKMNESYLNLYKSIQK